MTNRIKISNQRNVVRTERVRYDVDTSRFIIGETPSGTVNGVTTVFTCANAYVAGTLEVVRASLHLHPTTDFSETSPSAGTFTMVTAPATGEPVIVNYIKQ